MAPAPNLPFLLFVSCCVGLSMSFRFLRLHLSAFLRRCVTPHLGVSIAVLRVPACVCACVLMCVYSSLRVCPCPPVCARTYAAAMCVCVCARSQAKENKSCLLVVFWRTSLLPCHSGAGKRAAVFAWCLIGRSGRECVSLRADGGRRTEEENEGRAVNG